MASVELSFSGVDNKSAFGTVMPAMRGGNATHLAGAFTTSALLQHDGENWVAQNPGYVRILADAKVYVRFAPAADDTAAGQGSGWPVLADQPVDFSYAAGDSIRIAAAV